MHKWFLIVIITLIGSISQTCFATNSYNDTGSFILSLDNVFGFSASKEDSSYKGLDTSNEEYNISLLGNSGSVVVPRVTKLGIDMFASDNISFGTGLMVGDKCTGHNLGDNTGYNYFTLVLINPRIGYGISFSDRVGLWSRVGVTYAKIFNNFLTEDQFWIGVNSNLVINIRPGFSVMSGLMFDDMVSEWQTLNGSVRENDSHIVSVGAQFGMLAFF